MLRTGLITIGLGVLGYALGLGAGIGLVLLFSGNQHDRSMEAVVTGFLVTGPLMGVLFAAIGFWKSSGRRES